MKNTGYNGAIMVHTSGTPPLTLFFGPGKNRVKGKPRYRRSTKTPKRGI